MQHCAIIIVCNAKKNKLEGREITSLRVIAGLARGRKLKVPRVSWLRPTSDRVKESLFNILAPKVPGSIFLDLFAGSGSIGIEALSRGCARTIFVENNPKAVSYIRKNLDDAGLTGGAQIYKLHVLKALYLFEKQEMKFDIIFLDPPYFKQYEAAVLKKIDKKGLLKKGGIVVTESSKKTFLPPRVGDLFITRRAEYGDTALNFYHQKN